MTIRLPEPHDQVPADQQLDVPRLVREIHARGVESGALGDVDAMVRLVSAESRPSDVILVMSNGAFGGFIPALLAALQERFGRAT